jgi:hypothetical protein
VQQLLQGDHAAAILQTLRFAGTLRGGSEATDNTNNPGRKEASVIEVYLEIGTKKVFAMTRAWPGWGRPAKTIDDALEALAGYHPRYSLIAQSVGIELPDPDFDVVAEVEGNATTDFGAPGIVPPIDLEPVPSGSALQQVELLRGCLQALQSGVAAAPEELRKGPRGGGRNTSKIIRHVADADRGYATRIGVKAGKRPIKDIRADVFARCAELAEHPEETKWPLPYYLRRAAWHITDHLWEIEDKS